MFGMTNHSNPTTDPNPFNGYWMFTTPDNQPRLCKIVGWTEHNDLPDILVEFEFPFVWNAATCERFETSYPERMTRPTLNDLYDAEDDAKGVVAAAEDAVWQASADLGLAEARAAQIRKAIDAS